MNKWYINEIAITIALVILLVFVWNPWHLWMPDSLDYMIAGGLLVLVALYAGLVLKEKPQDEREEKLQARAGRMGFIIGVGVLSIGLVYQIFISSPDPVLIFALASMVVVKVFAFKNSI